jgi:protein-S-isoprenylcysteine O-methyltransferase Ste14
MVAGFAFRAWAIRELGRFFTVTVGLEEGHRVVDTGPYRFVRHPSYTGMQLFFVGLGIALDSWLSLAAAMLLPLAGIVTRILYEEQTLRRELGEPYISYSSRTTRLIPGIW